VEQGRPGSGAGARVRRAAGNLKDKYEAEHRRLAEGCELRVRDRFGGRNRRDSAASEHPCGQVRGAKKILLQGYAR